MKDKATALVLGMVTLVAGAALMGAARPGVPVSAATLPGMCNGRSDANTVVVAHSNGRPTAVPRFILNLSTDGNGVPTGTLILGSGRDRLQVTDWCRLWQHIAGQQSKGDCEESYPAGAITAHAVGMTQLAGKATVVRADVRELADGQMYFRVRYRTWTVEQTKATTEDSCADEGWTWVPAEEGWAPLDQMKVHLESVTR